MPAPRGQQGLVPLTRALAEANSCKQPLNLAFLTVTFWGLSSFQRDLSFLQEDFPGGFCPFAWGKRLTQADFN